MGLSHVGADSVLPYLENRCLLLQTSSSEHCTDPSADQATSASSCRRSACHSDLSWLACCS